MTKVIAVVKEDGTGAVDGTNHSLLEVIGGLLDGLRGSDRDLYDRAGKIELSKDEVVTERGQRLPGWMWWAE